MDNNRKDNRYSSRDSYRPENSRRNVNADVPSGQNRYMRRRNTDDDDDQWGGIFRSRDSREPDDRNIDKGSDLHGSYRREDHDRYGHRRNDSQSQNRSNREDRREDRKDWDEGNFFHTGPSPKGSRKFEEEQKNRPSYQQEEYFSNHHRNQDRQQRSLGDQHGHYGARPDSVYRRQDSLNYGDNQQGQNRGRNYVAAGSGYEPNRHPVGLDHNPHTEGPFTGSRYKEDDYRYGSGNHNFYKEGRYQRGGGIGGGFEDNKGFFERVGDGIRDAWDSVTNDDRDNVSDADRRHHRDDRNQRRNSGKGYESGSRRADESDTGRDRSKSYPTGYRPSQDPDRRSWTDYDTDREKGW
ncbi:hypothetical protein BH24BAC1_BH24BAC1_03140 [soil metagenome]